MTEAEWAVCTAPHKMLAAIVPKTRQRKMRLFACACVRRLWRQWEPRSWSVRAVETAERFADGEAKRAGIAGGGGRGGELVATGRRPRRSGGGLVCGLAAGGCAWGHVRVLDGSGRANMPRPPDSPPPSSATSCAKSSAARGTSSRRPTAAWLKWNDGTVRKMARSIYDGRDYDCLPLLADALEEAGCTDAAILAHCRGPGEHVRGCWCLDLLIGRV